MLARHRHFSTFRREGTRGYRDAASCERTSAIACDLHATIRFIISRQRFRITRLVIAIICSRKITNFLTVSIECPLFACRQQFVRVRYISDEKKKIKEEIEGQDPTSSKLFEYANHLSGGQLPQRNSSFEWGNFSLGNTWRRFIGSSENIVPVTL